MRETWTIWRLKNLAVAAGISRNCPQQAPNNGVHGHDPTLPPTDRVECASNGTVVAGYAKSAMVAPGKLKSTDGIYGLRFAHNTEVTVTGLTMTKN